MNRTCSLVRGRPLVRNLALLLALGGAACGGAAKAPPRPAAITLTATVAGALPPGTLVTALDAEVTLPAGVTVPSARPPEADGVAAVDPQALAAATTSPAAGGAPAKVRLRVVGGGGLAAGAVVTLDCLVEAGRTVTPGDFATQVLAARGFDPATGSTVDLAGNVTVAVSAVSP